MENEYKKYRYYADLSIEFEIFQNCDTGKLVIIVGDNVFFTHAKLNFERLTGTVLESLKYGIKNIADTKMFIAAQSSFEDLEQYTEGVFDAQNPYFQVIK